MPSFFFCQLPVFSSIFYGYKSNFELNRFFLQDCIGVIDGLHIPAHVPAKDQARFRNKKGYLSQNVLAACTFDLQFIFVYPGWEGSAVDSRVLRAVLDDPDQNFPPIPEGDFHLNGLLIFCLHNIFSCLFLEMFVHYVLKNVFIM